MLYKETMTAFEITVKLMQARLSNADGAVDKISGKDAANYFKELYSGILEVLKPDQE